VRKCWRGRAAFLGALLVPLGVAAQEAQDRTRIEFESVLPEVIQQRLATVKTNNSARQGELESLFREVGCGDLMEQRVSGSKEPNVICALPATGEGVIVVGAHFDAVFEGTGAVDDWSGAALLPSLYESLKTRPRRHRFLFIGFAGEERGLLGSTSYVRRLSKDDRAHTAAMVNLECLGLSPPSVWAFRADKHLLQAYVRVTSALNVPLKAVNVERVGDDDSHPFLNARVPVITIHSVTQETLSVLHSVRDQLPAINPDHYYAAYRLVAAYLAYLDSAVD
jgi:Peptidase family M28